MTRTPIPTREPDERMIGLLSEMQEERDELARALPDYLSAMKRWIGLVEAGTKKTIALTDGMVARFDLASMNEAQIRHIAEVTDVDYDAQGTWGALVESCERYYDARTRLSIATSKAIAYLQYIEDMEHRERVDNEVEMIFGTMMASAERHGLGIGE